MFGRAPAAPSLDEPTLRPAIRVESITKSFRLPHKRYGTVKERVLHPRTEADKTFAALRDVSVDVERGERFAIVGRNGSGKSTLLRCIAGIYVPERGRVDLRGRVAPFIELGVGFHGDLAARDNVITNAILLGLSRDEAERRYPEIVAFAGLEAFADQQLKNYSTGMTARLAFAVTVHVDADVLLFDEVLTVGDAAFRERCEAQFERLQDAGKTVVLVSHDMDDVRRYCHRALLLDRGAVVEVSDTATIAELYLELNRQGQALSRPAGASAGTAPLPTTAAGRRPLLGDDPRRLPTLVHTLARMDFKLKYAGTALNYVWAAARPFALFGVLLLVFTKLGRFNNGVPHYSTYLLTAVVLWSFFLQATSAAVQSLVYRADILRKLPLPHLAIPLAVVETSLIDLAFNFLVVLVFALASGVEPRAGWLELPLLVAILTLFTTGASLLLSALYVRFRDLNQLWMVVSQAIFYLTPIFYVASTLPPGLRRGVLLLNPVAGILTEARHAFVDAGAPTFAATAGGSASVVGPLGVAAVVLVLGVWTFARESVRATENL